MFSRAAQFLFFTQENDLKNEYYSWLFSETSRKMQLNLLQQIICTTRFI